MKKLGIYVHIPFCEKKCHYCDFTSITGNNEIIRNYVNALVKEIRLYKVHSTDYLVDTVFIGGGTPSAIDEYYIRDILDEIRNYFILEENCEISIEVNPGTIDKKKILSYKDAGVNRISMGIQSMKANELALLGRIHNPEDVTKSIQIVKEAGINNINGDLMFGLPHQNIDSFIESLNEVIQLNLTHISMYGLIIEEGTLMNYWYKKGLINLPDEDDERTMYHHGRRILEEHGFKQYEISNFSIPDFECRHNIGYWKLKPYLGFGISAHSNIDSKRYWNHLSFRDYFKAIENNTKPISGFEDIDKRLEIGEYMILGLRMNKGVIREEFQLKFNESLDELFSREIERNVKSGLLTDNKESIYLTEKGLDLSNQVEIDFLL